MVVESEEACRVDARLPDIGRVLAFQRHTGRIFRLYHVVADGPNAINDNDASVNKRNEGESTR